MEDSTTRLKASNNWFSNQRFVHIRLELITTCKPHCRAKTRCSRQTLGNKAKLVLLPWGLLFEPQASFAACCSTLSEQVSGGEPTPSAVLF
jgi:hypothetical protein